MARWNSCIVTNLQMLSEVVESWKKNTCLLYFQTSKYLTKMMTTMLEMYRQTQKQQQPDFLNFDFQRKWKDPICWTITPSLWQINGSRTGKRCKYLAETRMSVNLKTKAIIGIENKNTTHNNVHVLKRLRLIGYLMDQRTCVNRSL